MKEYTVELWGFNPMNGEDEFLDETSVDADSDKEALDTAADLFKEFHPEMDEEVIRTNMQITERRELTAAEVKEIES